jgi:hypothetical protein
MASSNYLFDLAAAAAGSLLMIQDRDSWCTCESVLLLLLSSSGCCHSSAEHNHLNLQQLLLLASMPAHCNLDQLLLLLSST